MTLFVDTSVWSLAFRRDAPEGPFVEELSRALNAGEGIFTTGLVVQEILQGVSGPRQRDQILARLTSFPLLTPDWEDHVGAADLFGRCRRAGVQIETVDALFAQLCVRYDLIMLTADKDFHRIAKHSTLGIWQN
ncbi:MAG: PIN domain-containing protein [Proteobacteria bacterium]|nr:PIN domain-containing protein [Pseudomonadota bacterium]